MIRPITDISSVRALAHPLRLAILDLLQGSDSANATECGAELGESPQTCSYHLRTLARSGFVERVDSEDARETRWRIVRRNLELETTPRSSRAFAAAATTLQQQLLERDQRATVEYLEHEAELEESWQKAAAFTSGTLVLTAAHVEQLTAEFQKLLRRYEVKGAKAKRAERVHVVFRALPRIEPKRRKRTQ